MVAGCLAVMMLALVSIAFMLRRAYAAPFGLGIRDFLIVAMFAGVALGAWTVGLVAMAIEAAP